MPLEGVFVEQVPYKESFLHVLKMPQKSAKKKGTILIHIGFDSFIEEFYSFSFCMCWSILRRRSANKYQHGNKNRWWIYHRYFQDNHFTDQRITKDGTENHRLYRIGYVPIRYHVKVKAKANPFLPEFDQYFCNRIKRRQDLAKECKQITMFMSNKKSNNSRVTLHRSRS